MSVDRRVALSNFYREEFLRHIEHLQASGILDDDEGASLESFPALAETLLQSFDTLSRLSRLDPKLRQRH
jgi:hypothetical protein